ncbi:hypothetical protein SLS60_004530 [Paraconiothyrium brasiliense]|uniref:Uncharacterized protein n=1 Tax=Paraconiothyrium brasiliense TaxID=300254 RepID=A0ABR3RKT0_9PLEO
MTIPDVSERTRYLIVKTLHKIEKEYVKAFLGGLFIEPGTVVRGDECNQTDPRSVIFSCTPYFDIQKPQSNNSNNDRLHPPRTLIQSYYPYEPVRDRDEEQAYRSIGNTREGGLIHVPALWMLNVDGRAVITCGYSPLSSDFTKSIKLIQEDLKQLGPGTEKSITSVRLSVPDGRVLLYSHQECGTYFQAEQRVRELRRFTRESWPAGAVRLLLQYHGDKIKATPANWPAIIRQQDVIFIDLVVVKDVPADVSDTLPPALLDAAPTHGWVPPFYHWPSALSKDQMRSLSLPMSTEHATKCLQKVEVAMVNAILSETVANGPVEQTFTSTKYYETLRESTFEDVEKIIISQIQNAESESHQSHCSHHQVIVRDQSSKLPSKAHEFLKVVHNTLGLFVGDVNKPILMRKVWGATANIAAAVERLREQSAYKPDPKEYTDPGWKTPKTNTRSWRIRTPTMSYTYANADATKFELPLPGGDKEFGGTLKRCKRCAREAPFDDPNAALKHLQKHAAAEASKQGDSASSSLLKDNDTWKEWIRNDDQALLESTMAGACAVLDRAIVEAGKILEQLKELADGVRDEEGNLSDLYSFPRKLLETLHRLLVFYFSVERSLHYTEEYFDERKRGGYQEDYPYSEPGLEVLSKFHDSVESSVVQAREELCEMVRTSTTNDALERLSWGAESISSWLIRRLIVKPLEKSMTVGDMYREYLSTLQFQVNHRPSKRLLRSINLLQEELTILAQVNDWQTRLVNNYLSVLDDASYPTDALARRALYPYERLLLSSCLDNLALTREEYDDQISRCGPLSNSTKQSAEINEEDHGKAILVFTVVTVIFLPLSFVTSYLGMNTSDIRDMENKQGLFWEIALPLTVSIMAIMLAIAYNGDEIRDFSSSIYRSLTGKQDRRLSARGISVLQRRRAAKSPADSSSTLSMADDAEYAAPKAKPDYKDTWYSTNAWDRSRRARQGLVTENWGPAGENMDIRLDVARDRNARSSARKPAFPSSIETIEMPAAVPYSYTETKILPDLRSKPETPPPPPSPAIMRRRNKLIQPAMSRPHPSRYDAPPPPPRDRPTYMRIHKKYIVPSVLDDAYLPWDYDDSDPDYIIIKQYLEHWETDRLFEQSKELMEGRGSRTNGQYQGGNESERT